MDFYKTEGRRAGRRPPQPMCFDNTACFESQAQSDSTRGRSTGLTDRPGSAQQPASFHFNDNHSSTGTAYSLRPEGHIYEEVGPPQPPPYICTHGEAEGCIPSVHHHTMDQHMMMRGSPSSLCSMCSRHCNGHRAQPSPPTLPHCNCAQHGMQQPFCNHHGSMPHHQIHVPTAVRSGHINPAQLCSPTCTLHSSLGPNADPLHHGLPCSLHPQASLASVTNQRYTAPTLTPDTLHNSRVENSGKPKNRSLSPFAFLRKNDRDSKTSTNTMLDSSSNESVLKRNRTWLIAIVLTLVLIVLLSVSVGLVVTFTVQKAGKAVTSSTSVNTQLPVERVTTRLNATVRVITGRNSVYTTILSQQSSQEYKEYADTFTYQANAVLSRQLYREIDYTEVTGLRNGSVMVDFVITLKKEFTESEALGLAKQVKQELQNEMNTTFHTSSFKQKFPIDPYKIDITPMFKGSAGDQGFEEETTSTLSTVAPTTELTTTTMAVTEPYATPPSSGICEPITDTICQRIHYNTSGTTYPNYVGHSNQEEAADLIQLINAVLSGTSCYDYLNTFSCSLLAPKCGENGERIPPCRRLCEAAFDNCGRYMDAVMSSQEHPTDCSLFPNSTDPNVCVDELGPVVPTATPSCPPNFFSCGNHVCIASQNRCDGSFDCEDRSDETGCDGFECIPGQFQCDDGQCIAKVWQCDGHSDCDDGSDELSCEPIGPCQPGEFKCTDGFNAWNDNAREDNDVCIKTKFTCDGTADCSDRSDEDPDFCKDSPKI
ncbi:uncharacterized protein [Watersipora subatra]|uniref:uncharacterized protein isoform X2 n=1 Tax=Watersipora subatra TaxID=2589382 RepID=UPI00355B0F5F